MGAQKFRAYPKNISIKSEILISFCVLLLGATLGLIAKLTDSVSIIGEIGTEIGIWIFVASLIAGYSRYPLSAAINVFLFFCAMLAAYYIYGQMALGFFPRSYFIGWLVVTLLSPLGGAIIWFSRADGIVGSAITALPTALLFAHGYPVFYSHRITLLLSIIMGIILCLILPKTVKQKAIAFTISLPLAFAVVVMRLMNYLPF